MPTEPKKNHPKVEQLRKALYEVPWSKAEITMSSGERFSIATREHVFVPPGEPEFILVVPLDSGTFEVLFVDNIAGVHVKAAKRKPAAA